MLGPIATLVVGCAAALIAWQQWLLARDKLRLDLFDRRFKIYESTREFLVEAVGNDFTDSHLQTFLMSTAHAEFFFGKDILEYLSEVKKRAADLWYHKRHCEHLPPGAERSHHASEIGSNRRWFIEQTTVIAKVFKPYLDFSQVKMDAGLFPRDEREF